MFPFADYLDAHPVAFVALVAAAFAINAVTLYVGGRRAERRFRDQGQQPIRFRERGASGYSNRSLLTKLGGARRALDVVVTDDEVWVKGIWPPFSFVGTRFDLTHRIRRSLVRSVESRGDTVDLRFLSEEGADSHIVLILKNARAFVAAVRAGGRT